MHRLKRATFMLEPRYESRHVHVAPKKYQNLSNAQDAHFKQICDQDFDPSEVIDWDRLIAILKNLKRTSCKIDLELLSIAGPQRDSGWTGSDSLTVANITDRMMYAMARSSVFIDRLAMIVNAFHDTSISIQSRGVYNLSDVTKNLRRFFYAMMRCKDEGEHGSGEVALSNRMGAIKTIESASELQELILTGSDLRLHSQIDPTLITSKFLQAVRSSVLRWLILDTMDCTSSDLAQVICKCKASLVSVVLKNIRLHHPGSRLLLLKELQECSKLDSVTVSKEDSSPLMHHSGIGVFSLKHYDGEDKAEVGDGKGVLWDSKEEVQKVLKYNIGQIKE
ncbi:hypothetical protein HII31_08540 [Pseudocercospora fuligena]|uniref:Uncharacterized protein n=1 Tax=Pseudocercospora fuligena TaxID=685502 RepID=A0A8H6REQ4_9PEZI|nr:hypothetical protein HII31_08540 [Pseudocercospora fuligena]